MRYERKFFIQNLSRQAVAAMIYQHPAGFKEIYAQRQVNSLYFDTLDTVGLQEKVVGNHVRQKYRARWYGHMREKAENPILEIKKKHGELGEKERFSIESFPFPIEKNINLIVAQQLPLKVAVALQMRDPSLLISYQRRYWRSLDRKFRITLDWDLRYQRLKGFHQPFFDQNSLILEVKYAEQDDRLAQRICSFFPFRVTRSSKYALGMIGVY